MFRRLCFFLLTLCLALPAAAAPLHCAPISGMEMPTAGVNHEGMHHAKSDSPVKQATPHDCIGCIASYSAGTPPHAHSLVIAVPQKPLDAFLLARLTSGPDTPPPRA
jgi:hypothetical protein